MTSAISKLVSMAEAQGLKVSFDAWSAAEVYWCKQPMPSDIRAAGEATSLEYSKRQAEPHMPAHERFFDRQMKLGIVFETGE